MGDISPAVNIKMGDIYPTKDMLYPTHGKGPAWGPVEVGDYRRPRHPLPHRESVENTLLR